MSEKRLPIFPTRMSLNIIETRKKSAVKGHGLLKRKSDALKQRYKDIEAEYRKKEGNINQKLRDALFQLSEAEFLGANIKMFVHECQKQPVFVKAETEQISGIVLSKFTLQKEDIKPILFLDRSGRALNNCRKSFLEVLEMLVELCALRNSFKILDEVLMSTNRRVNALEFSVIPVLENTSLYINSELDEQDREDFFRLKKIQKIKNKNPQN